MQKIIKNQFPAFGNQPWFIENTSGEANIKKECEDSPFIKKVNFPNCVLVGPKHILDMVNGKWMVSDNTAYDDVEINDEKFRFLRSQRIES